MAELNDINKGNIPPQLAELLLTGKLTAGGWVIDGVDITKDGRICIRAASTQTALVHSDPQTSIVMIDGSTTIAHHSDSGDLTQRITVSGLLGGIFFEDLTTTLIDGASDGKIAVTREWVDDKISAILDRVIEKVNISTDQVLATVGIGEVVTSVEVTTSSDYVNSGNIAIANSDGQQLFLETMANGNWMRKLPIDYQNVTSMKDIFVGFGGLTSGSINIVIATKLASMPSV